MKTDYTVHPEEVEKEVSEALKMTVDNVSKKTGVSYSDVEKFFAGETFPEKSALKKICGLLGLSVALTEAMYCEWKSRKNHD